MKKISLFVVGVASMLTLFAQPTISTFSPRSGPIGTVVAITGTGFSTTPSNNIVFFGAVKAVVNAASSTSLSVTVPAGASFDPISVTTNNLSAWSSQPFVVTFTGGGAAFSASSYAGRVDFPSGLDPRGFSIMDLDGDNKPEIVVANFSGGSLSIFRNTGTNGNITYAPKMDIIIGPGGDFDEPYNLTYADIDGDGKIDLVVPRYGTAIISVYKNNSTPGTISLAAPLDLALGNNNPNTVAAGDLDNDGRPDLVVTSTAPVNRVSIFRNTTSGGVISFDPEIDYSTPAMGGNSYNFGIELSDLDADGKLDMCIANPHANNFSIYRNTTVGSSISFAPKVDYDTRIDLTHDSNPWCITSGDIDGDGKQDIIVASGGDGNGHNHHMSVYRNLSSPGAITLGPRIDFATDIIPFTLAVCDLNGDGKLDIHTGDISTNTVSLLRNTSTIGNISFDTHVDFATPLNPRSTTADLNGDGKPEMITVNAGPNTVSVYKSQVPNPPPPPPTCNSFSPHSGHPGSSVTIHGNNFNSNPGHNVVHFGGARATVTSATATTLSVSVPTGGIYQPITVTTNDLTAYSDQPFSLTFVGGGNINSNSFGAHLDFSAAANPVSASMGDLDGDDEPDLVIANKNANSVSVFLNTGSNGTFSFAPKVDFATGTTPVSVSIGDFDGDGKPDLAVVNKDDNSVSILRNTGIIGLVSFSSKVDFATALNPVIISVGDMNEDGKPDMVIANNGSNSVSVLRNTSSTTGDLSFAAKTDFTTGANPSGISIADLDGDAKADIAVANSSANSVSVLRNTGTGGTISFAAKVDFTTGINPGSIAMGDLDTDGNIDLAVANAGAGTVSIFRNTSTLGSISFAARTDNATGTNPVSISIANLDGDEKPDLAIANAGANTVSVLRNTGTSGSVSFATKIDFATPTDPRSAVAGDLDGDGKVDLAISNGASNSFSVLSNRVDLALPVNLLDFSGQNNGNSNMLEWKTASEQNLGHFELQRSIDGSNYSSVVTINAAGTSNSSKEYGYTDNVSNLNAPVYYYRLKMVDIDGNFKYSVVVRIRINSKGFWAEVLANPFDHRLAINIEMPKEDKVTITLTDMGGKRLLQKKYSLRKGTNAIEINGLDNIPKGIYLLNVATSQQQQVLKLVK